MYKFEIHLHTSACSGCSVSASEEMLDAAYEKGYSGIVITNHFYHGNTCVDRSLPWREFVNAFAADYYNAREYGAKKGLTVLFGIEEAYSRGKEMLIYGLSPEIIADCPDFKTMNPRQMSDFIHKNGGIAVCAHPFRDRDYIPSPNTPPDISLFDGIEAYNHFNLPEENLKACILAENSGLFKTAGTDIHNYRDFGNAGIDFDYPVKSNGDFITQLKNGSYKLITPYNY